jgi:short-subunit dehydrogenase
VSLPGPFAERYGPWALVAGAGEGIGAAYADELAARGLSLALVDVAAAALEDTAARARARGADVRTLVADLADLHGLEAVAALASELDVGLLVYNAAVGLVGNFVEQSLEQSLLQLDVNCRGPLVLLHRLVPALRARGRGGIVLMSSASALRGAPLVATYAATKAWAYILGESLWEELGHDGIDVLAVLPGSTRTPGWLSSMPQTGTGTAMLMEPADVAREVLDTLGTQPSLIVGQANRDGQALLSSMDRADAVRMMGGVMREMYPEGRQADPTV